MEPAATNEIAHRETIGASSGTGRDDSDEEEERIDHANHLLCACLTSNINCSAMIAHQSDDGRAVVRLAVATVSHQGGEPSQECALCHARVGRCVQLEATRLTLHLGEELRGRLQPYPVLLVCHQCSPNTRI
jgi:hypothetical protein